MTEFTGEDVGKPVETVEGDAIGVVVAVDATTAYVGPEPGVLDAVNATLDWEGDPDEPIPIGSDDVREITDEAIRLEAGRSASGDGHDPVIERNEDTRTRDFGGTSDEIGGGPEEGEAETGGTSSEERSEDIEDAPPHGDETVTENRGPGQDH